MNVPLVSIMMPTYNHGSFIREALSGAVEQDYPNLEVVVSDDGSTDNTSDIILEFASKYPDRVVPIVGKPHLGITGNCNRNLRACTGKYIAFTAGDDLLLPGKIAQQVRWMEADESRVLCGHDVEVFDSQTGRSLYLWSKKYGLHNGNGAELVVRNHVPYCGTAIMVRANVIPHFGFDQRLSIVSDWKLWIDCLASGGEYGYIDGVYARYRRHHDNITSQYATDYKIREYSFRDQLLTLDIVEDDYPKLAQSCKYARSSIFRWQAIYYLLDCRRRGAFHYLVKSLTLYAQWKTLMMIPLSFLPSYIFKIIYMQFLFPE